jgi:hypothetical protein
MTRCGLTPRQKPKPQSRRLKPRSRRDAKNSASRANSRPAYRWDGTGAVKTPLTNVGPNSGGSPRPRIAAIEEKAKAQIERLSLEAQTAVLAQGLESDAAKAFLGNMSPLDELMPAIDAMEIRQIVDARHTGQESSL